MLSDVILSSMIYLVLYIVAVKAPPDSILLSTMFVSCKSKVVSPESNFICLALANFSAPITILFPDWLMSRLVPNFMLVLELGALIVC